MSAEPIPDQARQNRNAYRLIELEIESAGITRESKDAIRSLLDKALPIIWDNTAQFQSVPRLRQLYAKRDAVDFLEMAARNGFDFKEADVEESREQILLNLERIRDNVEKNIKTQEARGSAGRSGGAVGDPTTQTPLAVPPAAPRFGDPNDPMYGGDARRPGLRRR